MMDTLATSDELVLFKDLIPPMLASLKRCTQPGTNDEELLGEVLEVLAELAQTPVPVLNAHVPELVPFLLDMVKSDELDGQTRDSAGLVLSTLAEWKPKLIGKKGLVPTIVEGEQGRCPEQGPMPACCGVVRPSLKRLTLTPLKTPTPPTPSRATVATAATSHDPRDCDHGRQRRRVA